MKIKTIRIIKASSPDREGLLAARIQDLRSHGFEVLFTDLVPEPNWPYCAGTKEDRAAALKQAFLEEESDAIMWARGGYGSTELLELMPWSTIKSSKYKPIIGFSDACVVQSAVYTLMGRPSIHGPMPATTTWRQHSDEDVNDLIAILKGTRMNGHLPLDLVTSKPIDGILFGGNLAVLSNLIGTPYLPKSFRDHILIFEDIAENPGRIMRMLYQWKLAGLLEGVKALVFGALTQLGASLPDNAPLVIDELRRRFSIPVFAKAPVGHISPNLPFVIGAKSTIEGNALRWTLPSTF